MLDSVHCTSRLDFDQREINITPELIKQLESAGSKKLSWYLLNIYSQYYSLQHCFIIKLWSTVLILVPATNLIFNIVFPAN